MLGRETLVWTLLILSLSLFPLCVFYPQLDAVARYVLRLSGSDPPGVIWLRMIGVFVGIVGTAVAVLLLI